MLIIQIMMQVVHGGFFLKHLACLLSDDVCVVPKGRRIKVYVDGR